MVSKTWILGAPDPEMEMIESLLRGAGEEVVYATVSGRRVNPATAYEADGFDGPAPSRGGGVVYVVECGPAGTASDDWRALGLRLEEANTAAGVVRIDHHRPGDPGFGRPSAEFLPASSLGQVLAFLARLGVPPPGGRLVGMGVPTVGRIDPGRDWPAAGEWMRIDDRWVVGVSAGGGWTDAWQPVAAHVLIAAADHCLAAAYRCECPGVDPDALMRWRAESRAAFQHRGVAAVLADVEATTAALRAASCVILDVGVEVADMRSGGPWPELPEAAARAGITYLASLPANGGGEKVVLGAASAAEVQAFFGPFAAANGITGTYGDPERGFAGGFCRE